eukprot:7361650-Alexandrium_andersonii.AAC.1
MCIRDRSFLDRTVPPPAATGSSSRGPRGGDYQKGAKKDRLARSVELEEAVTVRYHRLYPGGVREPTDLRKMPPGPMSELPDVNAHDELIAAFRFCGDIMTQITQDAVDAGIDEE